MATDLTQRPAHEALAKRPAVTAVNAEKYELVRSMLDPKITKVGVALFLEICAHYDLAWEAKEAWAIMNRDQLLVMVGRDGLRKIATRNGINVRGDVVREKDVFKVEHTDERTTKITHEITGGIEARGKIVGAWAEAWDIATKEQRGYFYAADSEYRPKNEKQLQYSPWGSQEAVMILAAAERQAIRQATPLGGLMSAGEMDLNMERERAQVVSGAGEAPEVELPESALGELIGKLVERANELEAGAYPPARVALETQGQPEEALQTFADGLRAFIEKRSPEDPLLVEEAEVVDAEPVVEAPETPEPRRERIPEEEVERVVMEWNAEAYAGLEHSLADLDAQLDEPDLTPEQREEAERDRADTVRMMEAMELARDGAEAAQ